MKLLMKTDYREDLQIFEKKRSWIYCGLFLLGLIFFPVVSGRYITSIANLAGIYIIVALGLNLLTGCTGQISLGHAAFLAIGAYSSSFLTAKLSFPFLVALPMAGVVTTFVGMVVAIPALRLTGLYLAIATMAFSFIIDEVIIRWKYITNGANGLFVPKAQIGPWILKGDLGLFYLILLIVIGMVILTKNILRGPLGRALIAIRDSEIASQSMGISLAKYKTIAFGISAFYTGIAGSLFAHYMSFIGPENFTLMDSILYLVMIIVGGMGSVIGSIFGAIFVTFLTEVIRIAKDLFPYWPKLLNSMQPILYGAVIIVFIHFEPQGLYGRWLKVKYHWENMPMVKKDTFKREMKFYRSEKKR